MKVIALFIFVVVNCSAACAQSAWKTFRQLSCPEKRWVLFHPFQVSKAKYCTQEARAQTEFLKSDTLLDKDADGGQVDAFRHSYWMALLAKRMKWRKALSLGKAHEKGNYIQFKKGLQGEELTRPDSSSGEMDLYNNRIGVSIGCENRNLPDQSIKELIIKAVQGGQMLVIFKDTAGNSLDCHGRRIDFKEYDNTWRIPRCLKPSDSGRFHTN